MVVEWGHLLPSAEQRAEIEAVFGNLGDNPLRPVWGGDGRARFSYDEIRLVRLAWRFAGRTGEASGSAADERDPRSMMGR